MPLATLLSIFLCYDRRPALKCLSFNRYTEIDYRIFFSAFQKSYCRDFGGKIRKNRQVYRKKCTEM
ncbi:hypothetical protein GHT06_020292 [Daphnia sinensis]|uniref:Uncharacterized protein n=1 Tax=Daphnia sinensis TaxID=1820382 RepID=A0AAD5PPC5_9CRUS|nr:hypothetical protein GHT06_020292 [Daphnia sinensis]